MIDITKLKEGDSVKLRCGAKLEVCGIGKTGSGEFIKFNCTTSTSYNTEGSYLSSGQQHPFDIVEIIPKLSWDNIEQGQKLKHIDGSSYYYLCPDPSNDSFIIVCKHVYNICRDELRFIHKRDISNVK